jgi:hypothetical protein
VKLRHAAALTALAIGISGCAAKKDFARTCSSRTDGFVILSYVILSYEYGTLDWWERGDEEQGLRLATATCTGWGYGEAMLFGEEEQCLAGLRSDYFRFEACSRVRLMRGYHCAGATKLPDLTPGPLRTD